MVLGLKHAKLDLHPRILQRQISPNPYPNLQSAVVLQSGNL